MSFYYEKNSVNDQENDVISYSKKTTLIHFPKEVKSRTSAPIPWSDVPVKANNTNCCTFIGLSGSSLQQGLVQQERGEFQLGPCSCCYFLVHYVFNPFLYVLF